MSVRAAAVGARPGPATRSADAGIDLLHRWIGTDARGGVLTVGTDARYRLPPRARFAVSDLALAAPILRAGTTPARSSPFPAVVTLPRATAAARTGGCACAASAGRGRSIGPVRSDRRGSALGEPVCGPTAKARWAAFVFAAFVAFAAFAARCKPTRRLTSIQGAQRRWGTGP